MESWKDTLNAIRGAVNDVVISFGDNIENQSAGNRAIIDRETANTQIAIAEAQQRAENRDKAMKLLSYAVISFIAIMIIVVIAKQAPNIAKAFKNG